MVKMKNKTDEMKLRDEYRKNDRLYGENINAYDIEMRDKMRQKESMTQEFDQVHTQLTMIQDEYKQRLEERKKREEILAIMKKKNDEQLKQLSLLNKAAEWMQAHWRGLLARREMEKARKGKKKKKKK
jgi:predicted house-cleaning noncanonical NTP pyrophosphatase (MazG superfamily)